LLVQNDAKYVRWFYSQSKQSQHDRENFLPWNSNFLVFRLKKA
jgi:hypothetical protein